MRSDNLERHYKTCKFNENSCLPNPALDAGINSIHVGQGSGQQQRDPRISSLINKLVNSTEADEEVHEIREMKIRPLLKRKFPHAENPMLMRNIIAPSSKEEEIERLLKKRKILLESPVAKKWKVPYSDESDDDDDVDIGNLPPPPTQIDNAAEDTSNSEDEEEDDSCSESEEESNEESSNESEESEKEESLEGKFSTAFQEIIKHDRREIQELLTGFEKDVYYQEELMKLRKAVETWLENKISDEAAELDEIKKLLTGLQQSTIPRSKLIRLGVILDDINDNQKRLKRIMNQLHPVLTEDTNEGEQMKVLKRLLGERLISSEQYHKWKKDIGTLDFDSILAELTNTKIGRGLSFLPNTLRSLKDTAVSLARELEESNSKPVRHKLLSILEEILQRKGFSIRDYKHILESIN